MGIIPQPPDLLDQVKEISKKFIMGRHREFIGVELFSITKNSARCLVMECDYSYTPKRGSELHAKPLCEHLKRRHAEEDKKLLDDANDRGNSSGAECDREENSEEELEGEEAAHNSLEEVVNDVHLEANSVASVRCALHTLQLCVHDVLKTDKNIKSLLNKVRKIVNKTHTQNMRLFFKIPLCYSQT
ncbi:hypothetical protein GWK47_030643 [Chionoecetes opilio]|uniref:Uncharacterized protein n=1 Tax=Chionoecetes opilio TaxID=41210 RepID=A0A8J4YJJ5_CHIOP|nr:hypothetical protein GWK47_030643 [Chionoecetes opilio]